MEARHISSRRDHCEPYGLAAAGRVLRLVAALLTLAGMAVAHAETLGDARQLSRLGEPLRLIIPVRPDGGPPVEERCVGVAAPRESDGLPHILTANVAIDREGSTRTFVVTTATPVREPVNRLLLRTTCDGASRQYTVFLEPAGSTRQVRSVAQPGPQLSGTGPAAAASVNRNDAAAAPRGAAAPGPVVTTIPVVPAPARSPGEGLRKAPARAETPSSPLIGAATVTNATQQKSSSAPAVVPTATDPAGVSPGATDLDTAAAQALEAENQNLKQQLADLNTELQRLQQVKSPPPDHPPETASAPRQGTSRIPRWEMVWPVLVALAGLAALTLGGFLWRRRHSAAEEWALTGPPSHRIASRTSLAEEPVTFKQMGVRSDIQTEVSHDSVGPPARETLATRDAAGSTPPPALRLMPSTDDLARELEQELFIAERAHSALERAHPEIVDALTRSWGTAAARLQLTKLLEVGSTELARMSGEAVAELRLLLRIADDATARPAAELYPPNTLTPPTPAW